MWSSLCVIVSCSEQVTETKVAWNMEEGLVTGRPNSDTELIEYGHNIIYAD